MGGRGQFRVQSDDGWSSVGGYMTAKIQKLDQQFEEQKTKEEFLSNLFENVAIHVNGYTIPTADQLKSLMAQHGGKYHAYYSSTGTTHVIASRLPRAKAKDLRPNQKVVKPEWIVDSIKANSLLPIQPYIVAAHGVGKNQMILSKFSEKPSNSKAKSSDSEPCCSKSLTDEKNKTTEEVGSNQPKPSSKIPGTTDNNFLSDFYAHSRLHFLSTWKTELADFVRSLTSNPTELTGVKELLKLDHDNKETLPKIGGKERCIMHVDMDCFFVSVGLLSRPHLIGRPVAVTHHSSGGPPTVRHRPGVDVEFERNYYKRGKKNESDDQEGSVQKPVSSSESVSSFSEIASCNYVARSAGLKNGMFYGKAKELCPELVCIPYDFEAYREASRKLYSVLCSYTRILEAVSCDEALLDVTQLVAEVGIHPSTVAEHIRAKVKMETGCNASAGIGPNIALARMATRVGKPNGQHQVTSSMAEEFIQDHPVKDLPGVGYATSAQLAELGAATCGDLQQISVAQLKKVFGVKTGQKLYDMCRGIDAREVSQSKERKSVSADVNYGIRLSTVEEMKIFLKNLASEVSDRLNKAHVVGKKLTLKVMVRRPDAPLETAKFGGHGVCQTMTRSRNLDSYTDDCDAIANEAIAIVTSLKVEVSDLRGIGIQMTQLKSTDSSPKQQGSSNIKQFIKIRPSVLSAQSPKPEEQTFQDHDLEEVLHSRESEDPVPVSSTKQENDFNSSFLDALPDDIRREVEKDLQAQKEALERTKPHTTMTSSKPMTSKRGRLSSRTRGRKRGLTVTKGNLKVKGSNSARVGSPNKRITDMFRVVGKGRKDEKIDKIDLTVSSQSQQSDEADGHVTRNLQERFGDFCETQKSRSPSPPSLGGAITTPASRDAVRRWVTQGANSAPLEDDVNEMIVYLLRSTAESHDLERVNLVLRTLRRSIMTLVTRDGDNMTSWRDAYDHIVEKLQELMKQMYDGAKLHVLPIT